MGVIRKAAKFTGKVLGTVTVGTLGVVSSIVEEATKIDGGNVFSDMAYGAKSGCFNTVRKMWGKEEKEYGEATGKSSEQIEKNIQNTVAKNINRCAAEEKEKINNMDISNEEKERRRQNVESKRAAMVKDAKEDLYSFAQKQKEQKEKKESVYGAGFVNKNNNGTNANYNSRNRQKNNIPRVNYQEGASNNPTAFVFSCPGQRELHFGKICQGETGFTLSQVIEYCNLKRPDIFPYSSKDDYLITNASDIVHFKALTNDTEASNEEILAKENIKRLERELKSKRNIICMGERAKTAISAAGISGRVVYFPHHLSNQKLNREYKNEDFPENYTPQQRRMARIVIVSEELLKLL